MSQSTQLVNLPHDMLIEILDQLPIPDLISILSTNSQLKNTLYPVFADKIEDYQFTAEALNPAIEAYFKYPNRFVNMSEYYLKNLILLDQELSEFMGLEQMPKINGQTVYTGGLLYTWWENYVKFVLHQDPDFESPIILDQDMTHLINVRPSISMTLDVFIHDLKSIHTQRYFGPLNLEAQTKLYQEYEDFDYIDQQYNANLYIKQTTE